MHETTSQSKSIDRYTDPAYLNPTVKEFITL